MVKPFFSGFQLIDKPLDAKIEIVLLKFSILSTDPLLVKSINSLSGKFENAKNLFISETPNDAINNLLKHEAPLVFVDIDRKGKVMDPYELVSELHQFTDDFPSLVAVSSSKRSAYDVLKLGFFDFLLKPLNELDLRKCLIRFEKKNQASKTKKICLKSYTDYQFIDLAEILYLQADNNTTDFYLTNERKVSAYKTLKHFEDYMPSSFIRIHNSYIVNCRHIVRINFAKSKIALHEKSQQIPFSKSYKAEVNNIKEKISSSLHMVS